MKILGSKHKIDNSKKLKESQGPKHNRINSQKKQLWKSLQHKPTASQTGDFLNESLYLNPVFVSENKASASCSCAASKNKYLHSENVICVGI